MYVCMSVSISVCIIRYVCSPVVGYVQRADGRRKYASMYVCVCMYVCILVYTQEHVLGPAGVKCLTPLRAYTCIYVYWYLRLYMYVCVKHVDEFMDVETCIHICM